MGYRFDDNEEATVVLHREPPALDDLVRSLAPRSRFESSEALLGSADDSLSLDEIARAPSSFGRWSDEHDELAEAQDLEEPGFPTRRYERQVFADDDYEEAAPIPETEGTLIFVAPPQAAFVPRAVSTTAPPAPPRWNAAPPAWTPPPAMCATRLRPIEPSTDPAFAPTVSVLAPTSSPIERFLASPMVAVGFAAVFAALLVVVALVKVGGHSNEAARVQTPPSAATIAAVPVAVAATAEPTPVPPVATPVATPEPPRPIAPAAPASPKLTPAPAPKPATASGAPGFRVSFAVNGSTAKDTAKPKARAKQGAREPSVEEILATLREEQLKH